MIIENVKVINPHHTIANARVHLQGGVIIKIEQCPGEGKTILLPGFIDLHIHGIKGHDVMDGAKALQQISQDLAARGTTSFAPTLMTAKFGMLLNILQTISNVASAGANIIGLHLEGPFIAQAKRGAHNAKLLIKPQKSHIDQLLAASHNKLKKIVIAPEVTDVAIVAYLLQKKVIPSLGHSNARGPLVDQFIDAGVIACTHLWNGMSGVENRNPGIVQKVLVANQVTAELICDLVHVDQATLKFTIDVKTPDKIIAITDAIRPAQTDVQESVSGGFNILQNGGVLKIKGTNTIAGGNSVMHDNFKNLINLGYSWNDGVKMTSYNQAREFNLNKGEIKVGKDADLIMMDENLQIKQIFIGGKKWK